MARSRPFNLTAQLNIQGPNNLRPVIANIRRQLGTLNTNLTLNIDRSTTRNIRSINTEINNLNNSLRQTATISQQVATNLGGISSAATNVQRNTNGATTALNNAQGAAATLNTNLQQARNTMEDFGRQSALAVRRFAAFASVTSVIYGLTRAISNAFDEFVNFDREVVRLQQVTGQSRTSLAGLTDEITRLSTSLGVSSTELIQVSSTLAQAGLSASQTKTALEALAKASLAPSFDDLSKTVEGSIAAMRQFGIASSQLEGALGSINAVAAAFAVEAGDIIAAIQRTGGVFAAASNGVSQGTDALNEFIAVFTSVRATTRESAETIATGLRTIFTRIQRGSTIDFLKELGIQLTDSEGKFVGPFKAIERLSAALRTLDPRDLRYSQIVEELGGFRQIGKVIPLIQQFATAQQALNVAQQGSSSLTKDAITAQQSLANQFAKVREEFLGFIRSIGESQTFRTITKLVLGLASSLISVGNAFKPILPYLAILGAIKGTRAAINFTTGFLGGRGGGAAGGGAAGGGATPPAGGGTGGGGTQQNVLDNATVVANTNAITAHTTALGTNTTALTNVQNALNNLNTTFVNGVNALSRVITGTVRGAGGQTLNNGGKVLAFARGGVVPGSGNRDTVPAMLQPGEFVIRKKAVETIGANKLHKINKYASGGKVEPYNVLESWSQDKNLELAHFGDVRPITTDELQKYLDRPISTQKNKIGPSRSSKFDKQIQFLSQYENTKDLQKVIDTLNLSQAEPLLMSIPRGANQALRKTQGSGVIKKTLSQWMKENSSALFQGKRRNVDRISLPKLNTGFTQQDFADILANYIDSSINKDIIYDNDITGVKQALSGILNKQTLDNLSKRADIIWTNIIPPQVGEKRRTQERQEGTQRLFDGGLIQKFVSGGTVEELATSKNTSIEQVLLEQLQALGGGAGIKKIIGAAGGSPLARKALRKDAIESGRYIKEATDLINQALSKKGTGDAAEQARLSKLTKVAVAGLMPIGYSKDFEWDLGDNNSVYANVRGLSDRYKDAIMQMQMETSTAASRFAENLQYSDIFSGGEPLVFDFDETLVSGADILGPDGKPDIPKYSDKDAVKENLQKGRLTRLGLKLKDLVGSNPDFIKSTRVLTARPQSTADLLASTLQRLGLPYKSGDITGVGQDPGSTGAKKAANLSSIEKLIDDSLENISAVGKAGKKGFLYNEPNPQKALDEIIGQGNIEGAVIEKALALLGANLPPIDQLEANRAVDFPQGLGRAAQFFGVDPNIPTEVKRTLDSSSFEKARAEFARYFSENKFADGGWVQHFAEGAMVRSTKNRRRGAYGKRGFVPLNSREYEAFAEQAYAEAGPYGGDGWGQSAGVPMPKALADYADKIKKYVFETGGAGISLGKKLVKIPDDIEPEALEALKEDLIKQYDGWYSEIEEVMPFGKEIVTKTPAALAKEARTQAAIRAEEGNRIYTMAEEAIGAFKQTGQLSLDPAMDTYIRGAFPDYIKQLEQELTDTSDDDEKASIKRRLNKAQKAMPDYMGLVSGIAVPNKGRMTGLSETLYALLDQYGNKDVSTNEIDNIMRALGSKLPDVKRFANGGSAEDTVPALLTPGEFVINKKAAARIGEQKLHQLNKADKIKGYNQGGSVGRIQRFAVGGQVKDTTVIDDAIHSFLAAGGFVRNLENALQDMNAGVDEIQAFGDQFKQFAKQAADAGGIFDVGSTIGDAKTAIAAGLGVLSDESNNFSDTFKTLVKQEYTNILTRLSEITGESLSDLSKQTAPVTATATARPMGLGYPGAMASAPVAQPAQTPITTRPMGLGYPGSIPTSTTTSSPANNAAQQQTATQVQNTGRIFGILNTISPKLAQGFQKLSDVVGGADAVVGVMVGTLSTQLPDLYRAIDQFAGTELSRSGIGAGIQAGIQTGGIQFGAAKATAKAAGFGEAGQLTTALVSGIGGAVSGYLKAKEQKETDNLRKALQESDARMETLFGRLSQENLAPEKRAELEADLYKEIGMADKQLGSALENSSATFETTMGRLADVASGLVITFAALKTAVRKSDGGIVYAAKGTMVKYQPKGTDTVPAMLTPGEFVVNAKSTKKNLGLLNAINKNKGGVISAQPMMIGGLARTAADFIPFVGSGLDIGEGLTDLLTGRGTLKGLGKIGMGLGFGALDLLTFGGASLAKGAVKTGGKLALKAAGGSGLRRGVSSVAKSAGNAFSGAKNFAQKLNPLNWSGRRGKASMPSGSGWRGAGGKPRGLPTGGASRRRRGGGRGGRMLDLAFAAASVGSQIPGIMSAYGGAASEAQIEKNARRAETFDQKVRAGADIEAKKMGTDQIFDIINQAGGMREGQERDKFLTQSGTSPIVQAAEQAKLAGEGIDPSVLKRAREKAEEDRTAEEKKAIDTAAQAQQELFQDAFLKTSSLSGGEKEAAIAAAEEAKQAGGEALSAQREAGAKLTDEQAKIADAYDRVYTVGRKYVAQQTENILIGERNNRSLQQARAAAENFNNAINTIEAGLQRASATFSEGMMQIENSLGVMEGRIPKVSRLTEDIFTNIRAYSPEEIGKASSDLSKSLGFDKLKTGTRIEGGVVQDTTLADSLKDASLATRALEVDLPRIFRENAGLADGGKVREDVKQSLMAGGLSETAAKQLADEIANKATRQSAGGQNVSFEQLAKDVPGFLASIDSLKKANELQAKLIKTINDSLDAYNSKIQEAAERTVEASRIRADSARTQADFQVSLKQALGQPTTLAEETAGFDNYLREFTTIRGAGGAPVMQGTTDPAALQRRADAAQAELSRLAQEQQQGFMGNDKGAQQKRDAAIKMNTEIVKKSNEALKKLAEDGSRAAAALNKIQSMRQVRDNRRSAILSIIGNEDPEQAARTNRAFIAGQNLQAGNASAGDLRVIAQNFDMLTGMLDEKERKDFIDKFSAAAQQAFGANNPNIAQLIKTSFDPSQDPAIKALSDAATAFTQEQIRAQEILAQRQEQAANVIIQGLPQAAEQFRDIIRKAAAEAAAELNRQNLQNTFGGQANVQAGLAQQLVTPDNIDTLLGQNAAGITAATINPELFKNMIVGEKPQFDLASDPALLKQLVSSGALDGNLEDGTAFKDAIDTRLDDVIARIRESAPGQINIDLPQLKEALKDNTVKFDVDQLKSLTQSGVINISLKELEKLDEAKIDLELSADAAAQLNTLIKEFRAFLALPKPGDAAALARGGVVYASTGRIIGMEPKGTDTVPAMLTPGEFVVNRSATAKNLPLLKAINSGKTKGYSRGGILYAADGVNVGQDGNELWNFNVEAEKRFARDWENTIADIISYYDSHKYLPFAGKHHFYDLTTGTNGQLANYLDTLLKKVTSDQYSSSDIDDKAFRDIWGSTNFRNSQPFSDLGSRDRFVSLETGKDGKDVNQVISLVKTFKDKWAKTIDNDALNLDPRNFLKNSMYVEGVTQGGVEPTPITATTDEGEPKATYEPWLQAPQTEATARDVENAPWNQYAYKVSTGDANIPEVWDKVKDSKDFMDVPAGIPLTPLTEFGLEDPGQKETRQGDNIVAWSALAPQKPEEKPQETYNELSPDYYDELTYKEWLKKLFDRGIAPQAPIKERFKTPALYAKQETLVLENGKLKREKGRYTAFDARKKGDIVAGGVTDEIKGLISTLAADVKVAEDAKLDIESGKFEDTTRIKEILNTAFNDAIMRAKEFNNIASPLVNQQGQIRGVDDQVLNIPDLRSRLRALGKFIKDNNIQTSDTEQNIEWIDEDQTFDPKGMARAARKMAGLGQGQYKANGGLIKYLFTGGDIGKDDEEEYGLDTNRSGGGAPFPGATGSVGSAVNNQTTSSETDDFQDASGMPTVVNKDGTPLATVTEDDKPDRRIFAAKGITEQFKSAYSLYRRVLGEWNYNTQRIAKATRANNTKYMTRKPSQYLADGGPVYFADGGNIFKPRGTDTVPAMLTPGEFVVNRKATQANLGLLHQINSNPGTRYYNKGGYVNYLQEGGQATSGGMNMGIDFSPFMDGVTQFSTYVNDFNNAVDKIPTWDFSEFNKGITQFSNSISTLTGALGPINAAAAAFGTATTNIERAVAALAKIPSSIALTGRIDMPTQLVVTLEGNTENIDSGNLKKQILVAVANGLRNTGLDVQGLEAEANKAAVIV